MNDSIGNRYFYPGQQLQIRPDWLRPATPVYTQATVTVPGRLHFGVLDFSRMSPGLGGGGLGVSTDTVSHTISISRTQEKFHCDIGSATHLLKLFSNCVGYDGSDICIRRHHSIHHTHSGFGSNVSFNTAVIAGLNALFGFPFSPHEIWDIITQNYVENADVPGKLYFGLDTGVGEACFLYGGLVWVDGSQGQGRYIGNVSTPDLWVVTCVGDRQKLCGDVLRVYGEGAVLSQDTETELVASHFMACEQQFGEAFRSFIRRSMCPALQRNDIRQVLAAGWEMNQLSNLKVLEGIYRTDVLQALNTDMQQQGAWYAGMSSAGPGYFAFAGSEDHAHELARYLGAHFGEYFTDFRVGRAGSKMTIDLVSHETALSKAHQQSVATAN